MAAPSLFGSASTPADNGAQGEPATIAVTPPGSMVAGDLVVLTVHAGLTASGACSISADGGQTWSARLDMTGGTNVDFQVFWCQYNGTWGADPSVSVPAMSGTIPVSVIMQVARPADATNVVWAVDQALAGATEASASPVVITGITNAKKDTFTLAACGIRSAVTWGSVSGSGWAVAGSAQYRNTTGTDQSCTFAYRVSAAAGATGDVSITPSTATAGASFIASWYVSNPPTITPNTADATNFGSDNTPTLEATGTDPNADDLRYHFQIDSVNTFDSQTASPIIDDTYNESNQDSDDFIRSGLNTGISQSFTSNGGKLINVQWYIKKTGSPTGNATAKIYAHSGTFGSSSIPTGAALATSDNFDVATLTTSLALSTFAFSGANQISLTGGTNYTVTIEYSGGSVGNHVNIPYDNSSPSHAGNKATLNGGTWTGVSSQDSPFYVYVASPLLNKVSGTDAGFANTVSGGDTDPFNSGEKVSFTVQGGDALADGTWYWRARAKDPDGSNIYSSWTTTRTFTVTNVAFMPDFNRPILQAINRASLY